MLRRVMLVAVALTMLVAACGGSGDSGDTGSGDETPTTVVIEIPTDLQQVAAFSCTTLVGATGANAEPGVTKAIEKAAASGYSPPELAVAMRVQCPETMTAIEADATIAALFGV